MNIFVRAALLFAALGLSGATYAESSPSFKVISPIFDQLVAFSMPTNFVAAFENTRGTHYIREAVLKGETTEHWTQMITVTGEKGLSNTPAATPEKFAGGMAAGFKRACPDNFAAKGLGETKFGTVSGFVAVVGCGKVGDHSETALIAVMKGSADFYTIQWAERGAPVNQPPVEDPRWTERLRALQPIVLCTIVPGETAPYPSCIGKSS
ncbi:hypothetical protein [Bradyrhizobium sp. dw_78]|uniref:hypothetical protein n=1 Tax=Bradyrhizobium sp. dw_78 TaxID=2719793 RepID=UPI001BD5CD9D|nr:hypothetical protein [Bradyrhizobium sp. dw_78]